MTQPTVTTFAPGYHEEYEIAGEKLAAAVERMMNDGNIRRIVIKYEGYPVLEIPLTASAESAIAAPVLTAVGALGAAVTTCTIEVIRASFPEHGSQSTSMQGMGVSPVSSAGGQVYSISHSGMLLFQQGPIRTLMGETIIDLVSAPIEPGEYRLEVEVTLGAVKVFLPHYVQLMLDGNTIVGGRNVHEGLPMWKTMQEKLRYIVNLPDQPPDYALATYNPEFPVRIFLVTHITLGGVDIYRL